MNTELARRVFFTLGALLVYRLGSYIPLPGLDASVLAPLFHNRRGGILALADALSAGAVGRFAIIALGLTSYLTAAILVQFATLFVPRFKARRNDGAKGRTAIRRTTLYLTVALTALQALGVAHGLQSIPGLVSDPGPFFLLFAVLTLVAGTLFVIWLTEQISLRGIGNGISVVLLAGVVLELPEAVVEVVAVQQRGYISLDAVVVLVVLLVALIAFIACIERARRNIPVAYAARAGVAGEAHATLPMKLNGAGVIPPLVASWFLALPLTVAMIAGDGHGGFWTGVTQWLQPGQPAFVIADGLLIVLFAFVYTALVLDPDDASASLIRHGGVVPGITAGEATARHIDFVLSRTTVLGAIYLAFVCLIPEILVAYWQLPFYFAGTSLMIVVCAILDIEGQVRGRALLGHRGQTP